MRTALTAAALTLIAAPALAQIERLEAQGSVDEAFARLQSAVEEAGATVFATVDHGAGASAVDMELPASKLLIFGNPMLGTPIMQSDMLAGLVLPLKILVYSDGTQTYVAYKDIDETFQGLTVDQDLEVLPKVDGALANFAAAAAGG